MSIEQSDLKSIAELSMNQIHGNLSVAELIRIIRSVDYPFAGKERLEYFDRDTLERVVCLIRRWSQQRLSSERNSRPTAFESIAAPEEALQRSVANG